MERQHSAENAGRARLEDRLTGALIGLARATDGNEHLIGQSTTAAVVESLAAMYEADLDTAALEGLLKRLEQEKRQMVPNCFTCAAPCCRTSDYDMQQLWNAQERIRSLKTRLLLGIRELASFAQRAGRPDETAERFFYKALIIIGMEDWTEAMLQPIIDELHEIQRRCMELAQK